MINGFIVIDKPAGITSHDVVSRVRRIIGTRKVGHTGTLDPFATGVLPVADNDGTKVIPFLDEGAKTYEALLRLGVTTDTLDMTGAIQSESDLTRITLEPFIACLAGFTGAISQIPPMYSAIKQNGQPLYKLARQGIDVERKPRDVEIYSLELLSFDLPHAAIRVTCSRGTYVRSLADDIGRALGCGAALQELRRTASGPFRIEDAVTLDTLEVIAGEGRESEVCVTPQEALAPLPEIALDNAELCDVRHGRSFQLAQSGRGKATAIDGGSLIRLSYDGELVAVATAEHTADTVRIVPKRVLAGS